MKIGWLFIFFGIGFNMIYGQQDNLLERLLKDNPTFFDSLIREEKFQLQIIYTQINRTEDNLPSFKTFTFGLKEQTYFYPASTVKMPTALIALEKLNQLKIQGLDKDTPLQIIADQPPQKPVLQDTSAIDTLPSVGHFIKKVFLVSDNDAHNRLYEFCGQGYLNRKLREKGFNNLRIVHRLGESNFSFEDNQCTNTIQFYKGGRILYHQGAVKSNGFEDLNLKNEMRGKGYLSGDSIVNVPFDFSKKNFISLMNLHDMLKVLLFPESVPEHQRFDLSTSDYQFLYRIMSMLPKESDIPKYQEPDNYVKFFMFGDRAKTFKIPSNIKVFNKVGWAYGFLTDVAYIIDTEANIEFLVAATIHVNENQIYNDGVYEYETIGLPFFGNLGRVLYEYECNRQRKFTPDLSKFK